MEAKDIYSLTQLIVVRRDLPLVQVMVQGGHAIGIATYMYTVDLCEENLIITPLKDPRFGHPYRMWCQVQNETKLGEFAARLTEAKIDYSTAVEPDLPELQGQVTALCTAPYEKERLLPLRGNIVFDLKFENFPAFRQEAAAYVVKQLQAWK